MRFVPFVCLMACAGGGEKLPPMPATEASALGIGDVFEVRVFLEPDFSGIYRVAPDGTINYLPLGQIPVAGKTTSEVASDLEHRLRDGYVKKAQVSLFVKEYNSKKVFVLGQVARPGAFAYSGDMSIVSAIADAGGFTRTASPNQTSVTRVQDGREIRIPVKVGDIDKGEGKNFALAPGDIVYVPESIF